MKYFYIEGHRKYPYSSLIEQINSEDFYFPLFLTSDAYQYWKNFLKAVIHGEPIVLLDSDSRVSEIAGLDSRQLNIPVTLKRSNVVSFQDFLSKIKESKSRVTLFTSGTSGQPKRVTHTIETLTRNVRTGSKFENNTWGFAYNPAHMAGIQVFFQAIMNVNTLVNVFGKKRSEIYQSLELHGITHLSATPTFYRLLLPFEKSFPLVRRVTLGGESSSEQLYLHMRNFFPNAKMNNVYASTEAGALFSSQNDQFRIPNYLKDKIKIVDNELLIHSSLVGKSFDLELYDGFFKSGDIVEWMDESQGLFRFLSRKNSSINIGGYKVNPEEVENALLSISDIEQCRVFGKKNSVLGNILCADVVVGKSSQMDSVKIRTRLQCLLQDFKIPRIIKFVENLPMTRTGKLKRS